MTAMFHL